MIEEYEELRNTPEESYHKKLGKMIKEVKEIEIDQDPDVDVVILSALAGPPKITETLINHCVSYHFRQRWDPAEPGRKPMGI